MSALPDRFLSLLRCPETGQQLRAATPEELSRLGMEEALIREDLTAAYRVNNGIPNLLPENMISINLNPIS